MRWLISLAEAGYLELETHDQHLLWLCSAKGYTTLVTARYGKPLSGDNFATLLLSVLQRAREYNESSEYPCYIDKLYVFGSVLSQPWQPEDPNIVVESTERPATHENPNWRFEYYAEKQLDKHLTIVDQLFYPETEMMHFLKRSKERIHLYRQPIEEISSERKLLYVREGVEAPEGCSFMTLSEIKELGMNIDKYQKGKLGKGRKKEKRISNDEIVEHWKESRRFLDLDIAEDAARECCWRCGAQQDVQQCHIVPDALGGPYAESNLVLLCGRCHGEAPNLADSDIMFDWIRAYRKKYRGNYWINAAMDEYSRIYGKELCEEVRDVLGRGNYKMGVDAAMAELELLANAESFGATVHFGQAWLNNSTMAGCFRRALEQLPKSLEGGPA